MTLADLIKKATLVNVAFSTAEIPLKYKGRDVDVDFIPVGSTEKGYEINMEVHINENKK